MLNANISHHYYARWHISSLAWYHNGTEIMSGNKYTISNNGTTHMLRITSMVASDAGTYKVKIASINYYGYSSTDCDDTTVLPLLELLSLHAPVTFVVQEGCVPTYDPTSILSMLYVSENANYLRIELRGPIQSNSPLSISHISHMWYRNGIQLSDGDMYNSTGSLQEGLSLQIMYNNTADVTGDYVGILWTSYDINTLCPSFYHYLMDPFDHYRGFYRIPFASSFRSINSKIRKTLN